MGLDCSALVPIEEGGGFRNLLKPGQGPGKVLGVLVRSPRLKALLRHLEPAFHVSEPRSPHL